MGFAFPYLREVPNRILKLTQPKYHQTKVRKNANQSKLKKQRVSSLQIHQIWKAIYILLRQEVSIHLLGFLKNSIINRTQIGLILTPDTFSEDHSKYCLLNNSFIGTTMQLQWPCLKQQLVSKTQVSSHTTRQSQTWALFSSPETSILRNKVFISCNLHLKYTLNSRLLDILGTELHLISCSTAQQLLLHNTCSAIQGMALRIKTNTPLNP